MYSYVITMSKGKGLVLKSGIKWKLISQLHNYPADHWKWPHSYILELFSQPTKGALEGHISSRQPNTAGWTGAFVKVYFFFRGLPKPNEIFEVGTNAGI